MKLNCGPSYKTRVRLKEDWHNWFAWFPVRLADDDCRWLETVERKGKHLWCSGGWFYWKWKYRAKEKK